MPLALRKQHPYHCAQGHTTRWPALLLQPQPASPTPAVLGPRLSVTAALVNGPTAPLYLPKSRAASGGPLPLPARTSGLARPQHVSSPNTLLCRQRHRCPGRPGQGRWPPSWGRTQVTPQGHLSPPPAGQTHRLWPRARAGPRVKLRDGWELKEMQVRARSGCTWGWETNQVSSSEGGREPAGEAGAGRYCGGGSGARGPATLSQGPRGHRKGGSESPSPASSFSSSLHPQPSPGARTTGGVTGREGWEGTPDIPELARGDTAGN